MGIIYDKNVEEKELYKAYGLTVYGKINCYVWTIHNGKEEECLISLRIDDNAEKNLVDISLGNRCIFMENFNRTIDNFLYWIKTKKPDELSIEKQVFRSLCETDSLLNHRMESRKFRERQEEETRRKIAEKERAEREELERIRQNATKKGLLFYYDGVEIFLLKALNDRAAGSIRQAIEEKNRDLMEVYTKFVQQYPENHDLRIVQRGLISEIHI